MENRIRKEKVVIEKDVITYVSCDGKEFDRESECKFHEKNIIMKKLIEDVKGFEIPELEDVVPLNAGAGVVDSNHFKWYKVETVEQWEKLILAYPGALNGILYSPDIYCIEIDSFDANATYGYALRWMMEDARVFLEKFGYDILIVKK